MNILTWVHIAGGIVALLSGTIAVAARKGGPLHARAGTSFFGSMLLLGLSASVLASMNTDPDSPVGGIFTCYFVLTSWVAARRRDGITGRFEIGAGAVALGAAAIMVWGGMMEGATTPAGRGPIFALAGLCLVAGLGDLRAVLRKRLTPAQRIARHLWRMSAALLIAAFSFFLGQQDNMPAFMRGSPLLYLPPLAVLAGMIFWILRVRYSKAFHWVRPRRPTGAAEPKAARLAGESA